MFDSSSFDITKVIELSIDHIESPRYIFTFTHILPGRLRCDN